MYHIFSARSMIEEIDFSFAKAQVSLEKSLLAHSLLKGGNESKDLFLLIF